MIYAIAAVLVLILDQWLKYWVTVNIALDTGSITLIPGVLDLVNIHNTGAAFGILQGGAWRWIFVVIALVFVVIAVYAIRRGLIRGAIGRWAVVGVLAGAIGNCIDRVLNGYVVDMFQPVFLKNTVFGAIFNVADIFISCCGILFCLYILFGHEYKSKAGEEDDDGQPVKAVRAPAGTSGARRGRSAARPSRARRARRSAPASPCSSRAPSAVRRSRRSSPAQSTRTTPSPSGSAPRRARPSVPPSRRSRQRSRRASGRAPRPSRQSRPRARRASTSSRSRKYSRSTPTNERDHICQGYGERRAYRRSPCAFG